MKRYYRLVAHMQENHRLNNKLSDSSDSESNQAEPIQVSTELKRLGVITKKANRLPGSNTTKHADLNNPKPRQPNRKNPSHQEHPKLRQLSTKKYFNNREGLNHPPRAAPSNGMPKTPADFASLPREHGAWRRQATTTNTGSDENDQRLQERGATSTLMTSSTPTKKRRRRSTASENPPKRLRPDT